MSKVSWKYIFVGFQETVFKRKLLLKRSCTTTLRHYKARQVLFWICIVLTTEMAQKLYLWQELLKSTSKI